MLNKFYELFENLNSNKNIISFNETQTKQTIILKILHILDWDIFNSEEVAPEFFTHGKRVDYALKQGGHIKVFVEAKRAGEDLDKHQEQLLQYAFQEGVELAVLTNGITWWFYLPLQRGNWKERKFCSICIDDKSQDSSTKVTKFVTFLSKEQVKTGKALLDAENEHKIKLATKDLPLIADNIKGLFPEEFSNQGLSKDETFIDFILDEAAKLHGVMLNKSDVIQWLQSEDKKTKATVVNKIYNETNIHSNRLNKMRYLEKIKTIKSRHAPSARFTNSLKKLYDIIVEIVAETGSNSLSGDTISKKYKEKYHMPKSSSLPILPTDVCYNMVNLADQETKFLIYHGMKNFEFVDIHYVNDGEEKIAWTLRGRDLPEILKGNTYDIGIYRNGHFLWNEEELKKLSDDILLESESLK